SQFFNVTSGQIEETYKSEKDAGDIFAMQDAVADEVGKLLLARFAFTLETPAARRGTENEEAYRLYLQGMYFYDRRTGLDARKAVETMEQVVQLDPNYAQAWAGKAHAHRTVANFVSSNIHGEYQKSIEAINKALELDKNLSEAHSALCENKMYYEYDFAGAERECKRAIELKPNSAVAHNSYSRYLASRGRFDEAIAEIKTAIDLDPTSFFNQLVYMICLTYARRYDEAVRQLERIAEMNPNNADWYFWLVGGALTMQGTDSENFERLMRFQALAKTDEET
ncbi:MAG: tetratricopeptide repeat protein, partial [Pyrinomonadaceae bacterium]